MNKENLDFNSAFKRALSLLEETSKNIFIMGKAGTGKSTLLSYFRDTTSKKIAVLAPTGVAAVNIQGQTIHSFFKFKPNVTLQSIKRPRKVDNSKKNIYQKLEAIIIDEISMVRADLMDCIDKFLRLNRNEPSKPFGGIQMIFIGDLYQLPPVVSSKEKEIFKDHYKTPYFFSAHFFEDFSMELVELEHVYRQKDPEFINILNAIRNNSIAPEELYLLNQRVEPHFIPAKEDFYIHLVPTNAYAEEINETRLAQLTGPPYSFEGRIEGDFEKGHLPTLMNLNIKVGSQIMMVNNDLRNRWINGTIGKVLNIIHGEEEDPLILTELETGKIVEVSPHTWEIYKVSLVEGSIQSETVGTFTQHPMKLAWAITIHKSQGKTFNKAIIDIGRNVFISGQTYVALSRCTSLEGMTLKKPIEKKHIWTDHNIIRFLTRFQYQKSEEKCSLENKVTLLKKAIEEETPIEIIYLKANDTKTKRKILPVEVGPMTYMSKTFEGLHAFCLQRKEARCFRVDRILEIC